jgi:hypothetical protein
MIILQAQNETRKMEAEKAAPVKKEAIANMNRDLEKQFFQGVQRKDGRKIGLGFQ